MSLIVGQYYRGDPKQKPKQWGSVSAVSSILRTRFEDWYGIQYNKVSTALLFWSAGWQYNYASRNTLWSNTGVDFVNNQLIFNGAGDILIDSQEKEYSEQTELTIIANLSTNKNGTFQTIIAKRDGADFAGAAYHFRLGELSGDKKLFIYCGVDTNSCAYASTLDPLTIDETYNIGVSLDLLNTANGKAVFIRNDETDEVTGSRTISFFKDPNVPETIGDRYGGGMPFYGTMSYLFTIDQTISANQMFEITNNIYNLIQPPTFRTYFDLLEAGTTLVFSPITSNSVLNNDILSAIRLLNPNNISCFTEISDSILSGLVNILQGNDLSDESQITQVSIQAIRKLIGQEISSLSQITNVILSIAKQFNLNDLESLTEITNVVFSVINKINGNNLLSDSQIIDLAINVIRKININSLESISDITNVVLSITGGLRGVDIEAQTKITSLSLSILRVLKENNIESNSSVNEATLNVIHQLDINNINSLSDITDLVAVAGSNIGITDNNSLTQITQAVLDIIRLVSLVNINIESETSSPVISVLRTLFSNTINIVSNITSVGVTNISTAATGKVTITFSMAVPSVSWSLE